MSSQDRREAPLKTSSRTPAAPSDTPAKAPPAASNYPPKARYPDAALPHSHRPTSA